MTNRINKDKKGTYAHILAKVNHNFGRLYYHICKEPEKALEYLSLSVRLVDQLKLAGSNFTKEVWHLNSLEDKQAITVMLEKVENDKN